MAKPAPNAQYSSTSQVRATEGPRVEGLTMAKPAPNAEDGSTPLLVTEGSVIGRFVAIITPFFALFAGWLAGVVAKAVPGVTLDRGQIAAFMVAVATSVLTTAWKWLQGWQQHEQNVADRKCPALKAKLPH